MLEEKIMNYKIFKKYSLWLSQFSAAISLISIVFVKSYWVFVNANLAGNLVIVSIFFGLLTLLFGLVSLPRWQGFVAMAVFGFVAYLILFTPLYAVS